MSLCPSPETLGLLAHDLLNATAFVAMEVHVETCSQCQGVLERLVGDSSACEVQRPARLGPTRQPPTIPGFVIEHELGRGGMGVVYQAWQPQLARHVAIKVVSVGVGIGAEDREHWLREAQAIARLRHRNIVQLHQAEEQDGCLYLVLDLIAGGSLADRVSGPLKPRVAAGLMVTVARAVEYLHRAGMVHLDLKPSNILLDGPTDAPWDQVVPMITDFGIARLGDDPDPTVNGQIGMRGTPSFMAPEQITGHHGAIGPHSDIFALGATLYTLLTGRSPFQASSVIETLDLVRSAEPPAPSTLVPRLPLDLETIALTCLNKSPHRRYASAAAIAEDLQRWLDGFPIRARPVSKLEHARRWCRRRPAFALLLTIFALTVSSSIVGLFTLWRDSEAQRSRAERALGRALESDKSTSLAVRELVGLLMTEVDTPQMLWSERVKKSSNVIRNLTLKLRQDRGSASSNLVVICDLECQLAIDYRRRAKYDEARELLMDALELLEGQRRISYDPDHELAYARILIELAIVSVVENDPDVTLAWYQRAEEVLIGEVRDAQCLPAIFLIDGARRSIASLLGIKGQKESGRVLMDSHIAMLDRLNNDGKDHPEIGLFAALIGVERASDDAAYEALRIAIQRFSADKPLPEMFVVKVAHWIADSVQAFPADSGLKSDPETRPDPDIRAKEIIEVIESRCKALGVYPYLFPHTVQRIGVLAVSIASEQRKAFRLDEARQTSACLSALAKRLILRDPNEAVFHLTLCDAFEQQSKSAWEAEVIDYAAIEEAWMKALDAARCALRLNPTSTSAGMKVASIQDKLAALTNPATVPTVDAKR